MRQSRLPYPKSYFIIGINIAVFLILYLLPGLVDYLVLSLPGLLVKKYIWTVVTYMFVHGGMPHLLFNTVFFLFAGPAVEQRMGSREFVVYYLICGALAGLFSVFAYYTSGILGASGALYAVMLAFATYFPETRILVFFVLPMRAPYALVLFAVIDLVLHARGGGGVAHLTHLSGLIFGFFYMLLRLRINPVAEMRERR